MQVYHGRIKMSMKKSINSKELRRKRIISKLLDVTEMIRGSYIIVKTKCGKPACWCVDGDGHQHARITWTENGKGNTRAVPDEDDKWLTKMTKTYRDFRQLKQELVALEADIKNDLAGLEQKIISKTRKGRDYLESKIVKSKGKSKKVPKKNKMEEKIM